MYVIFACYCRIAEIDIEEESDDKLYSIQDIKNLKEDCSEVDCIEVFIELNLVVNTICNGYRYHFFNYVQKPMSCQIIVRKVEEKNNWYDNVCNSFEEEVNIIDGRFRCTDCKRNIPYPEKQYTICWT